MINIINEELYDINNNGLKIIQKLILEECPDYDFNRYRFENGDIVKTLDGAVICVEYSMLDCVKASPIKRSMKIREKKLQCVYYNDLPYYEKGKFNNSIVVRPINKIKWSIGDIIEMDNMTMLLEDEDKDRVQSFCAYVLESKNNYYIHTHISIDNPMRHYFI